MTNNNSPAARTVAAIAAQGPEALAKFRETVAAQRLVWERNLLDPIKGRSPMAREIARRGLVEAEERLRLIDEALAA